MEITCSFQKRTGGVCGLDKRYIHRVTEILLVMFVVSELEILQVKSS